MMVSLVTVTDTTLVPGRSCIESSNTVSYNTVIMYTGCYVQRTMIVLRPLAPVFFSMAFLAMASRASSVNVSFI